MKDNREFARKEIWIMTEIITKSQFDELLAMAKYFEREFTPPTVGKHDSFELHDATNREKFFLDIDRGGKIELGRKVKLQNRYYSNVLVRLEINSSKHMNPDGKLLSGSHIHIYTEGYGDSWAFELKDFDKATFDENVPFEENLTRFCEFCNIVLPEFQTAI